MSTYGPDRLIQDLIALGFAIEKVTTKCGAIFAVASAFDVPAGRFGGRVIGLGIQSTADFPRTVHSAIHVNASPQLYDCNDSVPNVRNIQKSILGDEWRYWSKNFNWT